MCIKLSFITSVTKFAQLSDGLIWFSKGKIHSEENGILQIDRYRWRCISSGASN